MPIVIIAGGTSASLGRSITTAIITHTPTWTPVILSRPSSPIPDWLTPLLKSGAVQLRRADYTSSTSLTVALAGAHTVLSVLAAGDATWFTTQLALLAAAQQVGAKRFAPSEFGVGILATPQIEALSGNVAVWEACEASGLEWTRFENGLFMNYLGFGAKEEKREQALGGRGREAEWCFYVTQRKAQLPVKPDGSFPKVTLTAVEDVGVFVARSLDLETWETSSYMVGQTLGMDEVVHVAERTLGRERWEVSTVTQEVLKEKIKGEKDSSGRLWWQLGLMYTRDREGEGYLEPRLNGLFPDIKPLSVEEYFEKYYK